MSMIIPNVCVEQECTIAVKFLCGACRGDGKGWCCRVCCVVGPVEGRGVNSGRRLNMANVFRILCKSISFCPVLMVLAAFSLSGSSWRMLSYTEPDSQWALEREEVFAFKTLTE